MSDVLARELRQLAEQIKAYLEQQGEEPTIELTTPWLTMVMHKLVRAAAELERLMLGHNEYNRANQLLVNENDALRDALQDTWDAATTIFGPECWVDFPRRLKLAFEKSNALLEGDDD